MPKQYVMSVMAANRVGILAALATALDELGGSFVDASLAVMRQYFTIIMKAEFPADRPAEVIVGHIEAVCRPFGGVVTLKDPDAEDEPVTAAVEPSDSLRYQLRVSGEDRRGVLRRVAHRLAQEGIDVTDLDGYRKESDRTFLMALQLAVPQGVDVAGLARDLDSMLRAEGLTTRLIHERVLRVISRPESLLEQA